MTFNWIEVLILTGVLAIVVYCCRKISYHLILKTSNQTGTAAIVYLSRWWWLLYSAEKYDIEQDYNWHKIQADQRKGASKELAIQREKVVALQMLQYQHESAHKVEITWRDEDNLVNNLVTNLDEFTLYQEERLAILERDFYEEQEFLSLLGSIVELGGFEDEDL